MELSEARAKIAELTNTVTDLQRAVSARSKDSEDHKHEVEAIKQKVAAAEEMKSSKSSEEAGRDAAEVSRLQAQLAALQEKHDYAIDQYEKQLAVAASTASWVAESEATLEKSKQLEKALSDALASQVEVRKERDAADAQFSELQKKYEDTIASLRAKDSTHGDLKQTVAELQVSLNEARNQTADENLKKFQSSQQAAQAADAALKAALERAESLSKAKKELQLNYETKLTSLEHQLADHSKDGIEQKQLQAQLSELKKALEAQLETAKAAALKQQETEKAFAALQQSSQASSKQANSLNQEIKKLESDKAALSNQVKTIQDELATASNSVKENRSKQTEAAKHLAQVQKDLDALTIERDQLKKKSQLNASNQSDSVKDKLIQSLQAQLDEHKQQQAQSAESLSSAAVAPVVSTAVIDERALNELKTKHSFELKQLDKELNTRIISLQSQVKSLEVAAKSQRKDETDRQREIDAAEARAWEAEEELRASKEQQRKDRTRAEELLIETKAAVEAAKKNEEQLNGKLSEARQNLKQQKAEIAEAMTVKQHRASMEAKLAEERKKNRELQARIEQIKKNRASSSLVEEKDE